MSGLRRGDGDLFSSVVGRKCVGEENPHPSVRDFEEATGYESGTEVGDPQGGREVQWITLVSGALVPL